MLAIQFEFTSNRYHATQWGRHVNEGVLEWPPSPWRIQRAIVATWRRRFPDVPPERIVPILEALASECPDFHLPPASSGHSRHYMPYNEGRRERTTLVFDAFVAVQPGARVVAIWKAVELNSQQAEDLQAILRNMPYLGRAESWIESCIASDVPEPNAVALSTGALPEGDYEVVRTLIPRTPIQLKDLLVETSDLRRGGQIEPSGAEWWMYARQADCFARSVSSRASPRSNGEGAEVVRFALSGPVLPMAKDTLRWGDLARRCAMSRYGRRNRRTTSPTLSGKDEDGIPLRGHRHGFYLPTDENGDGKLDHLTIWAPGGLTSEEFSAAISVDALRLNRSRPEVGLIYQAHGVPRDFEGVSPLFRRSRRWQSLTPYVLTRHVKFRGPKDGNGQRRMVDGPEEQIQRESALRWPNDTKLKHCSIRDGQLPIAPMRPGLSNGFRPIDYFRYRERGSNGGGALNCEIEFSEPKFGPIVLGFGCHYGLGVFVPAPD